MAVERLQRRLAAILSADVVGYSRLMGIDEVGLSRLNALRRELIDTAIAAHSGRIVKLMGDGALVEFASAVDAVTCAIEIQRQLREHDASGSEAEPGPRWDIPFSRHRTGFDNLLVFVDSTLWPKPILMRIQLYIRDSVPHEVFREIRDKQYCTQRRA